MERTSEFRGIHAGERRKRDSSLPRVPGTPEFKKVKLSEISPSKRAFRSKKRNKRASHTVLREDVGDRAWRQFWLTCREGGVQYQVIIDDSCDRGKDGIKVYLSDLVWLANETTRLFSILNEDTTEEEGEDARNPRDDQERSD